MKRRGLHARHHGGLVPRAGRCTARDQIAFRVGVFTNLTEDHLDFHKTMDAYCDAKAMLFTRCRTGVVNVDDAYAGRILAQASCRCLTYSAQQPASLRAKHLAAAV